MSKLGITLEVTSVRSAESAEVDVAARLDKVWNCVGPALKSMQQLHK